MARKVIAHGAHPKAATVRPMIMTNPVMGKGVPHGKKPMARKRSLAQKRAASNQEALNLAAPNQDLKVNLANLKLAESRVRQRAQQVRAKLEIQASRNAMAVSFRVLNFREKARLKILRGPANLKADKARAAQNRRAIASAQNQSATLLNGKINRLRDRATARSLRYALVLPKNIW